MLLFLKNSSQWISVLKKSKLQTWFKIKLFTNYLQIISWSIDVDDEQYFDKHVLNQYVKISRQLTIICKMIRLRKGKKEKIKKEKIEKERK